MIVELIEPKNVFILFSEKDDTFTPS